MKKKLAIGVLGCANIAKRSVIPAINSMPGFNLIAVASRSKLKAKEFADIFDCEAIEGYQNLLDRSDIDLVYIPLPTGLHEEWIMKALEAGKHVLAEKSLSINYVSASRIIKKAKEKGLLVMENFMFLYHSQHAFVKNLLSSGEIGELRCFRSSFGFPSLNANNFRYSDSLGGGALLDAGAYTVRASQMYLVGRICAEASTLVSNGTEVNLYGGAYLKSSKQEYAEIAFGMDNFYQCNYEIWGSKGKIIAERAFTPSPDFKPTVILEKQNKVTPFLLEADNHFVNILNEVHRCILEKDFENKYLEIKNQSRLLQEIMNKSK